MICCVLLLMCRSSLKLKKKFKKCHWQCADIWSNFPLLPSFPLLLSLKNNGTWKVALTSHLLEWPVMDAPSVSFFWESLLFSLNSLTFCQNSLLMIHIHLSFCGCFMLRLKVCWGQGCSFKLTAQLTPADFQDQVRFIFLSALS